MGASRNPISEINCSVCGSLLGTTPGTHVFGDVLCTDPICVFQGPVAPNEARDALIVNGVLAGVPVTQVAFAAEMSRQRVYQILDNWKAGV